MHASDIHTERFILAVKRHPIIYSRKVKHSCEVLNKANEWVEVCKEIFSNWEQLPSHAKYEMRIKLLKRWKSLRTCFVRELNLQKQEEIQRAAGETIKRRKIYEHFDTMSFLLEPEDSRVDVSNVEGHDEKNDERNDMTNDSSDIEDSTDPLEPVKLEDLYEEATNVSTVSSHLVMDTEFPRNSNEYQPAYRPVNAQDRILEMLNEMKKQEQDDDRQFIMSLIPSFKKLNDKQKFEAKIGILKVLKDISFSEVK